MIVEICATVSDRGFYAVWKDGKVIAEHDSYVPDFMPENHYGDDIELEIDVETGKILNWTATKAQVLKWAREHQV